MPSLSITREYVNSLVDIANEVPATFLEEGLYVGRCFSLLSDVIAFCGKNSSLVVAGKKSFEMLWLAIRDFVPNSYQATWTSDLCYGGTAFLSNNDGERIQIHLYRDDCLEDRIVIANEANVTTFEVGFEPQESVVRLQST